MQKRLKTHIKNHMFTSRWMYPARWLWTLIKLPHILNRIAAGSDAGISAPLPFSCLRKPEPWLERAEKRQGRKANALSPAEKEEYFYTYFSEIWDDN